MTYKPTRQHRQQVEQLSVSRRHVQKTRQDTQYCEIQEISDSEEDNEGVVGTPVGSRYIKCETDSVDSESVRSECWTPGTFAHRTDQLLRNISRVQRTDIT